MLRVPQDVGAYAIVTNCERAWLLGRRLLVAPVTVRMAFRVLRS